MDHHEDQPDSGLPPDTGDCERCHSPETEQYIPVNANRFFPGEICAIHESPFTFVHLATRETSYRGTPIEGQGARPAVIVQPAARQPHLPPSAARNPRRKHQICLLATFGGEADVSRLCAILQFFCVPTYPHRQLHARLRLPTHVHTSPEWCGDNTWLIAYPFPTISEVPFRWSNRGPNNLRGSSFRLDDEQRVVLRDLSQQKRTEWEELLAHDPDVANRYYKEYKQAHNRTKKERSQRSQATSAASTPGNSTTNLPDILRPAITHTALESSTAAETLVDTKGDEPDSVYTPATSESAHATQMLATTSQFGTDVPLMGPRDHTDTNTSTSAVTEPTELDMAAVAVA
ncbi:hypothetical protein BC628DRAFT_1423987 [Trametes gibbosa]|nr:hypothetical protein BC628DRAFT_1423987 [Trametes gibbosa]